MFINALNNNIFMFINVLIDTLYAFLNRCCFTVHCYTLKVVLIYMFLNALIDKGFVKQHFLGVDQHMAFINTLNAYPELPDVFYVYLVNDQNATKKIVSVNFFFYCYLF